MSNAVIVLYEGGDAIPDATGLADLLLFTPDPFNVLLLTSCDLDYEELYGAI
jgi:hypothetical protein